MSLRRSSSIGRLRQRRRRGPRCRRIGLEALETRRLLAGDVLTSSSDDTADPPGIVVLTSEGRQACPALRASSGGEGESGSLLDSPAALDGPAAAAGIDLSASIVQPAGPLSPGASFSSTIQFANQGTDTGPDSELSVDFDSGLANVTWQRSYIPSQPATVTAAELDGGNGFVVTGTQVQGFSGISVSGIGDVNSDGLSDFAVGMLDPDLAGGGAMPTGEVYVVFGTESGFNAQLPLSSVDGSNGFVVTGLDAAAGFGLTVDAVGDVNDDNLQDFIIGSPGSSPGGRDSAGSAVVIFGSSTGFAAQLDATSLDGSDGFRIDGLAAGDTLGFSVSGAGDLNDDGIQDVVVGAKNADATAPVRPGAGQAYVIFGKSMPFDATFDLSTLDGSNGFVVQPASEGDELGAVVDNVGDVNGDDIDDVLVTAPQGNSGGGELGAAYVIYGRDTAFSSAFDVTGIDGNNGMEIIGIRAGQRLGFEASGLGDINADGIDDIMVAEGPDADGSLGGSRGYIVFGQQGTAASVDLAALDGANGLAVTTSAQANPNPMRVSEAGDVNGDGIADALISMAATTVDNVSIPGGSFVLFGRDTGFPAALVLADLDGSDGFVIEGMNDAEQSGEAVGAAGDINGDGFADVLVGAPFASPGGILLAGQTYVVFGRGTVITQGSGAINETLDLYPGDQVVYDVDAEIAAGASGSTTVNATATVGGGMMDSDPANNTDSAVTQIATPPQVLAVIAGSTAWDPVFIDAVDGGGVGAGNGLGIQLSDQLAVPHSQMDRLYVQFDQDMAPVTANDFEVLGTVQGGIPVVNVLYSAATQTAELQLGAVIGFDKIRLAVSDALQNQAGQSLDGDGNGSPGGVLDLRFNVSPGDINGDGQVFTTDLAIWQSAFNALPQDANYDAAADINGDGQIFTTDLPIWQSNFNEDLALIAEPPQSSFSSAAAAGSSLSESGVDQALNDSNFIG
ncbi:hypothetical protein FYK55_20830 [Roseiconus nitratireducens]|uniref:Dockerin domain-containing protein n=1 Tax=Roseiconus nitratireducens TaxID=2605748 RepID=A0A5M6D3Z8_9BACT|nr:dockerin type I domain-containing protein [Roseiconus nitratireducens]KAA5540459.1 hypothetical protein FYK55_20830 [Roseiconus nitratireducens]